MIVVGLDLHKHALTALGVQAARPVKAKLGSVTRRCRGSLVFVVRLCKGRR